MVTSFSTFDWVTGGMSRDRRTGQAGASTREYRIAPGLYRAFRGDALTSRDLDPYVCRRSPGGGIGRRAGFRYQWLIALEVRVLSWAPVASMDCRLAIRRH